jgi:hypothetical protein
MGLEYAGVFYSRRLDAVPLLFHQSSYSTLNRWT